MNSISWAIYAIVVLSTLAIHELGHYCQMMKFKIPVERITIGMGPAFRLFGKYHLGLFPVGASVSPNAEAWLSATPYQRFMVALAGPMASLCAGGMMLAMSLVNPSHQHSLAAFASLHLVLGMVNLIPVPPLDGWVMATELCALKNKPLSPRIRSLSARLGNGLIYGAGFWFISKALTGEF